MTYLVALLFGYRFSYFDAIVIAACAEFGASWHWAWLVLALLVGAIVSVVGKNEAAKLKARAA